MLEKDFQKEVDSLLVLKSKKIVKKVQSQYKKIQGIITIPHHNYVSTAKIALESFIPGSVQFAYAERTLIALRYAETHHHRLTQTSMLEDIISGSRINFSNYR